MSTPQFEKNRDSLDFNHATRLKSSSHYIKTTIQSTATIHPKKIKTNDSSIETFFLKSDTMLLLSASLLALFTSIALLLRHNHSQPPTLLLYILYATTSIAFSTTLHSVDAEPWAYLLGGASLSLYATIKTFHWKYHKITLKGPREGSNRRARRRER